MCPDSEQYDRICRAEFACIREKLDRLDQAIRGNGKPGIQLRLNRLEEAAATRARLLWIIAGAAVTAAAGTVWRLIFA